MFNLLFFIEKNALAFIFAGIIGTSTIAVIKTKNIFYSKNKKLFLFKEFSPNQTLEEKPKIVQHSYEELIKGTKKFNNGNYVLYYGSEKCPYCNRLLYSTTTNSPTSDQKDMTAGDFYRAYKMTTTHTKIKNKNIKFIYFSDEVPPADNYSNDDHQVLPWKTWLEDDLTKGRTKNAYIRNDESAINFRKIKDFTISVYGPKKAQYIPITIAFKDGVGQPFTKDTFKELEENLKAQNEGKEEKDHVSLSLPDFLKYWYANDFKKIKIPRKVEGFKKTEEQTKQKD